MMLPFLDLVKKYRMKIDGVLHVGAHLGEEAATYDTAGIKRVWWVEANPAVQGKLRTHVELFGHKLIEALVYEKDGVELEFHVTNYDGMSSSILEFGTHPKFSPDTVFEKHHRLRTKTVDTLVSEHGIEANFLSMDLQGAELHCLRGARKFLEGVDYVMTELNLDEVYKGCAKAHEIDAFLDGFDRVETLWVGNQGWGDGCFVRRSKLGAR